MTFATPDADAPDRHDKAAATRKVIYAAVAANLGIAVAKFIAAAVTGSAAMMAEGIHSAVDTGNELLLLIGEKRSSRPADARHPFGYGKSIYFWALVVALSVFSLGGGLSINHGVHGLMAPEPLQDPFWSYLVLAVAFVFEGYSWNVSRLSLNSLRKPGSSLWQAVRASKDASVFTVFIEDSAALLGVLVAAAGIGLAQWTGEARWDPAASVVIGLLLIGAAFTLARETGALLVGEGMGKEAAAALRAVINADPAIEQVGRLASMQMGPSDILLTAAVQFKRGMTIDQVEQAIDRLERAVNAHNGAIHTIYFESSALRSSWKGGALPGA
ncbi:cation diffusion facilitator family transporter [Massilia sp. DWR3-1-1]|uniref:cation diffusion facilitator family transporter n=1 Tax=Massilia sp. DWR3-1-1 TaxID=2804559 RepID=UPI003CF3AA78